MSSATLDFISERRGRLLLHAGGLGDLDGRSTIVHGETSAGKTTLTAALVSMGLTYLSDETCCIDPQTLQIEPFRKPLTVKPGSQGVLSHLRPPDDEVSEGSGNWQIPYERLGGPELPGAPLRPAVVVFPDYDESHDSVSVTSVGRTRAAFVLGEQSSALWAIEPRPLAAVARLVNAAPAFQVSYSDAFEAAPVIANELLPNASAVSDDSVSDEKEPIPSGTAGPRRGDDVDWMVFEDEAVLFDGEHLHHLDPPGTAIWQALDGTRALPDVAGQLAEQFDADTSQVLLDVEDLVRVFRTRNLIS